MPRKYLFAGQKSTSEDKAMASHVYGGFSLIRTFELRSKIGCISEMKINQDLFCISLDLHYLCRRMSGKN